MVTGDTTCSMQGVMHTPGQQVQFTNGEQGVSQSFGFLLFACSVSGPSPQLSKVQQGTTANVITITDKIIANNFIDQTYDCKKRTTNLFQRLKSSFLVFYCNINFPIPIIFSALQIL